MTFFELLVAKTRWQEDHRCRATEIRLHPWSYDEALVDVRWGFASRARSIGQVAGAEVVEDWSVPRGMVAFRSVNG